MKTNKEIAVEQHAKDSDFQVKIDLSVTLPKSWFVAELYQNWGTVNGHKFYRYPCGGWVCRLEYTASPRSVAGHGETIKDAIQDAIQLTASAPQYLENQR